MLNLDKYLIGQSRTRSANSLVTDSAAGATAFSCGLKANNSAISTLPDGSPCGSVLEAAKKAGYMTGLVVTTRITDATPACFSAHTHTRGEEDRIAEQQLGEYPLGRMVDLMLGGGRCHFLPKSIEGSCRSDDRDLTRDAQEKHGWHYISDRAGFDKLDRGNKYKLPLLGLFANTDIPYAIDRDTKVYPTLMEMAEAALRILDDATKDSDQGFFLLIEGSRIDHAGHDNDPAAQVREVIEYSNTFEMVAEYFKTSKTPGIVVGTSDHETGGLAISKQLNEAYPEYLWYPQVLINVTHSSTYLAAALKEHSSASSENTEAAITDYIRDEILKKGLGIDNPTDEEIKRLKEHKDGALWTLTDIVSRRAQIGWSTHGHSAADVNIYSNDPDLARDLQGNRENTEVGNFLAKFLEVDVDAVTRELRSKGASWLSKRSADGVVAGYEWMGRTREQFIKERGLHADGSACVHGDGYHLH